MPDAAGAVRTSLKNESHLIRNGDRMSFSIYGAGNPLPPVVDGQTPRRWDFSPGDQSIDHAAPHGAVRLHASPSIRERRARPHGDRDAERSAREARLDGQAARQARRAPKSVIRAVSRSRNFSAKPDGATLFPSFMRALDEDLLAIDAASIELRRRRNGKLFGLELVDGATINRLVGDDGRPPK
jgi:hypothetical protein